MRNVLIALISVLMISSGQLLFKKLGLYFERGGGILDRHALVLSAAAFLLYGTATILWIIVLRTMPLSKAYPIMALSFVIVPVASYLLFQERIDTLYGIGLLMIVSGVALIALRP